MKKRIVVATLLLFGLLFLYVWLNPPGYTSGPHPSHTYDYSNIHTIGIHCLIYADELGGRFPTTLSDLFDPDTGVFEERTDDYIQIFVKHNNYDKVGDPKAVDKWTDYVYVPGHTQDSPRSLVLLFLPGGHHYDEKFQKTIIFTVGGFREQLFPGEFAARMNETLAFLQKGAIVDQVR